MRLKITLLAIVSIVFGFTTSAQKFNLSGQIIDDQEVVMAGVSVFLLDAADSTFVQYASSDSDGIFSIKNVAIGDYLIQTPFVGFKTLYTPISVKGDSKEIAVSKIIMLEDSQLDEITVETDAIPMRMKGDTLEYNAAAFKTRANDVAEDLIKQLPGVDVDKDGNIKTQGEDVTKVLVNGKEFFGDDKKLATKNLPAESIEKVQVFDQQSDQSELSGIDDGNTQKTINIELKKDASKGTFGRLNIGGGYNDDEEGDVNYNSSLAGGQFDRFDFDASINRFTKKMQLSFLGQANNTNKQGFSFQDYIGFIGGYGNLDGNRWEFNSSNSSVPLSGSGTSGLSESFAGGLNYSYDFSKNTKLMTSYFYSLYGNSLRQSSATQNSVEGGTFSSGSGGNRETDFGSHSASLRFDHKFDSTNNLRIRGSFKKNDGNIKSADSSFTNNLNGDFQNSSRSIYKSTSDAISFNANVLHSKRLKKLGRVLTTQITGSNSKENSPLLLNSEQIFNPFAPVFYQDQDQLSDNNSLTYSGKVTFTEPIGKKRYIELNVSHQNNNYESVKEFYNLSYNSNREITSRIFDENLSTNFSNEYMYNSGGLSFRQNRKKYKITLGADFQKTNLNGEIISLDTSINKEFNDILPRVNVSYNFTNSKRFMLRYRTNINAPSVNQLLPAQNNTNPLNIYVGNSDLDRSYNHSLYTHYLTFDQFNGTNFYTNIYAQYTTNKIVNSTFVTEDFVRITEPINVDYDLNISNNITYGAPLKFMKSKFNTSINNGLGQSIIFVNSFKDKSNRISNSIDFSLENTKKDMFDILVGVEFSRTNTQYEINTDFDQTFFTTTYFAELTVDLNRWSLNTAFDYSNYYGGDAFESNQIVPIFEASISRQMFDSKRTEIKFTAYDILNKNIGFERTSNLNYFQEQRTNNLSRYFMLSVFYKIGQKSDEGGMNWGGRKRRSK